MLGGGSSKRSIRRQNSQYIKYFASNSILLSALLLKATKTVRMQGQEPCERTQSTPQHPSPKSQSAQWNWRERQGHWESSAVLVGGQLQLQVGDRDVVRQWLGLLAVWKMWLRALALVLRRRRMLVGIFRRPVKSFGG